MDQARSRPRTEPKSELKKGSARQRPWRANLAWTVLNVTGALMLLVVFLSWNRSARPVTKDRDDAAHLVQPPSEESYEPVQLIARADAYLSQGSPAAASQLYRRAIRGQQKVPNALTYRLAVCFELLGESEDALRLYRGMASHQDSLLAFAAQLGQARLGLRNRQLDVCHELLSRMAAVSALPALQASGIAEDVAYLLALVRAANELDSMPQDPLALDSVETPDLVFSADHLLRLAVPSERRAIGQDAPLAPRGMHVHGPTNGPYTTTLTANFSGVHVRDVLESTANATQWVISLNDEARQLVDSRTVRIHLQDTTAASMLTLLLDPLQLVWTYRDQTLVIRRAVERREGGQAAVSSRQTEQFLRTALAFYPNHELAVHAYVALGNIAFLRQELDPAVSNYREATRRFPSHPIIPTALFNLAKTQYVQQRWAEARQSFYRVVDERNGHNLEPVAYLFLGRLHLESGDIASAKRELSRAASLATAPDTLSTSSLTLAVAYLMLGHNHAANMELMKHRDVFQKEPIRNVAALLSAVARFRVAALTQDYLQQGSDLISAVAHVAPADFFGDFGYLLLGDVYTELGFREQVAVTYQDALERNISSPIRDDITFRLAMHYELDQRTKCRELLEAVVESESTRWSAEALLELASLSLREDSLDECLRLCQQALAEPRFAQSRGQILRILGQVYERQDDYYNAAVCFAGLTPGDLIEPPSETRP